MKIQKLMALKISKPPAGDGTPSKNYFSIFLVFIFVRLNLASLKTQHTEYIKVIAHPICHTYLIPKNII